MYAIFGITVLVWLYILYHLITGTFWSFGFSGMGFWGGLALFAGWAAAFLVLQLVEIFYFTNRANEHIAMIDDLLDKAGLNR